MGMLTPLFRVMYCMMLSVLPGDARFRRSARVRRDACLKVVDEETGVHGCFS